MTSKTASWETLEIEQFRETQRHQPVIHYERLADSDRADQEEDALDIMRNGWALDEFPRIRVEPPVAWDEVAAENRSWDYRLHSWDFLGPALCTLDQEDNDLLLSFVVAVAQDWADSHQTLDAPSGMAWYDMAVAKRSYRLARILDLAARSSLVTDSAVRTLLRSVRLHQIAFTEEGIFKRHSNHGLYVASGQKAMSRRLAQLPGMDEQHTMADERLQQIFSTQFTTEGVHREHSPDYHRMILSTIRHLDRASLMPPDSIVDIRAIEESLAWFVVPDGTLAMFGDTPRRTLSARDDYRSSVLQFAVSAGQAGRPPDENWRAFPESGYAVYRSGWPDETDEPAQWTYLALNAAFHNRNHKHADDLSFVWYDRGSHILVDSGRYGYLDPTDPDSDLGLKGFFYADPRRVYAEETRAHNAVDIDGQSYQRRGVEPYGSAIRRTGEKQGTFFAEAHAEHLTLDRSSRIQHTRLLVLKEREWLIVYDKLWDPRNHAHQFRQWFQFAPHLQVEADDIGWSSNGTESLRLWGVPLLEGTRSATMRGVDEPELQGWISYKDNEVQPTTSVCVAASGSAVSMATLFCFSEVPPLPGQSKSSDNELRLSWSTDRRWDLKIDLRKQETDIALVVGNL